MTSPRTEAGKALLRREDYNSRSFPLISAADICLIEDEAAVLDVERLMTALRAVPRVVAIVGHSRDAAVAIAAEYAALTDKP